MATAALDRGHEVATFTRDVEALPPPPHGLSRAGLPAELEAPLLATR